MDMEDHDDDDAEDELEFLPRLQVFVRPQEEKASGSHEREEEGVGSQEREETQPMENQQEDEVLPDANPRRNLEDRQGLFLVRQLKPEHRRILHDITLAGQRILVQD